MAKKITKTIVTPNQFVDVTLPKFSLFSFELQEKDYQTISGKTQEVLTSEKTFSLVIDASQISKSFIPLLSEELKGAFGLNFAPYNYQEKKYNFYTSSFSTTLADRKKRLEGIFETLADFEVTYKEKIENNKPIFEEARVKMPDFETEEFIIKYSDKLQTFIALSKSFMGPEMFRKFASCSERFSKVMDDETLKEMFTAKNIQKKTCFIINKNEYVVIDELFKQLKNKNEEFLNEQSSFIKKEVDSPLSLEVEVPNIFDFKIKVNEERKCFEFFCKGYEVSHWEGNVEDRKTLANWALNFILSAPTDSLPEEKRKHEYEIANPENSKVLLNYQKDSSKKEKKYLVPLTEMPMLKIIYDNFQRENIFWSRPQYVIKKTLNNFERSSLTGSNWSNFDKNPGIFLNSDGQAYFVFEFRDSRSIKSTSPLIAMKGVKISFQEFEMLMNTHLFSKEIKENTFSLNVQIWSGLKSQDPIEERQRAFDDVFLAYKLNNYKTEEKQIPRKMKI